MNIDRVCSSCFGNTGVRDWIREQAGARGCDACGKYDSPTVPLNELCEYLEECLRGYWGFAVEQLPYESREGGYQGTTWDTIELVFDEVGLELPRDERDKLFTAICQTLSCEVWCDYDWLRLDEDVALQMSWDRFCHTIKYERRFFFHKRGGSKDDLDSYSHEQLLGEISRLADKLGLIRSLPKGTTLWRARTDLPRGKPIDASMFGPPPAALALQSNRMNPPGIPMFYAAENASTAVREIRCRTARVAEFELNRDALILDLVALPPVPEIFSNPDRERRLGLSFLHDFTQAIMQPVARDERVHIEYIPSQIVTEYLREHSFECGKLDGVRFPSTLDQRGRNVVLFIDSIKATSSSLFRTPTTPPLLNFVRSKSVTTHSLTQPSSNPLLPFGA